ncbi:MAG: hypothetical protein KA792_02280 [Bacteroidales bacterium]|nr:hypothetical protein [Bacteroidales bacterium]
MKNLKIAVYVVAALSLFLISNSGFYLLYLSLPKLSYRLGEHPKTTLIFFLGVFMINFILLPLYTYYRFKKKDF